MVKKAFLYTALRNAHLRNGPKTGQNGTQEPETDRTRGTILTPAPALQAKPVMAALSQPRHGGKTPSWQILPEQTGSDIYSDQIQITR